MIMNRTVSLLGLETEREKSMVVSNLDLIEQYITARKAERGLTPKGEQWIRSSNISNQSISI